MAKYDYKKNPIWVDHIEDEENGIVIQRGTPHTAKKMNNMEEGIKQANDNANVNIDGLAKHKDEKLPHIVENLDTKKKYYYGLQVKDGNPQLVCKEVV